MQKDSTDTELSRAFRERDELQAMLLGFEKNMEDIQTKVKLLTTERDQLSAQYQQVTGHNSPSPTSGSIANTYT